MDSIRKLAFFKAYVLFLTLIKRGVNYLTVKGVIDRIVDDKHAVLLVGLEEVEKIISIDQLPPGSEEGTWLILEFTDEELVNILIDTNENKRARERIEEKMKKLRSKGGSKFKTK